ARLGGHGTHDRRSPDQRIFSVPSIISASPGQDRVDRTYPLAAATTRRVVALPEPEPFAIRRGAPEARSSRGSHLPSTGEVGRTSGPAGALPRQGTTTV